MLRHPLVLLAGGASSRMGAQKALQPYRGQPWIQWQARRFLNAGGASILVVASAEVESSLKWHEDIEGTVTMVIQDHPLAPMADSLHLAFRQMKGPSACFLLPVDVPGPEPADWLALQNGLVGEALAVLPEAGGHPVLLGERLVQDLRSRPDGDWRLDHEILALDHVGRVGRVSGEFPASRRNLNDPDAWREWSTEKDGTKHADN